MISSYSLHLIFLLYLSIGKSNGINGQSNWVQDETSFSEALQSLEDVTKDGAASSERAYEQSYGGITTSASASSPYDLASVSDSSAQSYGLSSDNYGSSSSNYGSSGLRSGTKGSTSLGPIFLTSTVGKSGIRSGYGQRNPPSPSSFFSNTNAYGGGQSSGKKTSGRKSYSENGIYRTSGQGGQSDQSGQSGYSSGTKSNSQSKGKGGASNTYGSPSSVAKGYGFATGTSTKSTGSRSYGPSTSGSRSGSTKGSNKFNTGTISGSGYGNSGSGGSVKGRGGITRSNQRPSFTETVTSLGPLTGVAPDGSSSGSSYGSTGSDFDRRSYDFGGEKRGATGGMGYGSTGAGSQSFGASSSSGSVGGNSYGASSSVGGNSYGTSSSAGGNSYSASSSAGDSGSYGGSSDDYSDDSSGGLSAFGNPGVDFPTFSSVPETGFTCANRLPGYYADTGAGCQAFYICQSQGRQDGFLCPNATLFNQEFFVCDWWYNVDCSMAESFYSLNANLFQEGASGGSYGGSDDGGDTSGSGYGSRTGGSGRQQDGTGYGGSSGDGGQSYATDDGQNYGGQSSGGYGKAGGKSFGSGLKGGRRSSGQNPFGSSYNSDQGFGVNDGQVRMTGSGRRGIKGRQQSNDGY